MKKRAFIMLGLAFVLAVTAVFVARDWLQQQVRPVIVQEQAAAPTKTILVARSRMEFGDRLRPEHVHEIAWPANTYPAGAFESQNLLFDNDEPRVVLRTIEPNEPILASRITGPGGRGTLSAIIGDDMRAVTLRVNDVLGVAGFVLPGDKVDILLTRDERKDQPITDILLQNVRVLGIDQEASEKKDAPQVARAVTLEVTPRQAQKLTLAAQVGTLSLALRNYVNSEETSAHTVTISDLKFGETVQPAKARPQQVKRSRPATTSRPDFLANVKVVRGLKARNYKVAKEGDPVKKHDAKTQDPSAPARLTPEKEVEPAPNMPMPLLPGLVSGVEEPDDGTAISAEIQK